MSCGCGKSTPPAGSNPPPTGAQAQATPVQKRTISAASAAAAGTSTPVPRAGTQSYTLTTRDGRTQTFGSQLEANAEKVRRGGGTVRPVR